MMQWSLLIACFFIGSAYAMHLEYLKVDSAEELLDGTLDSVDWDELIHEAQLPGKCWACEWAMKKLKKELGDNANQGVIKTKLLSVCNSIGFLRGMCKKLINRYLDTLVEELSTTDDPKTICVNVGICSGIGMLELIQVFPQKNLNN